MIVAGFGCRPDAGEEALHAALASAFPDSMPDALATLASRRSSLQPLARHLGLPLILLDPEQIAEIATPTRSSASLAAYHTGSVAEATALIAAGPFARLIASRVISPDRQATCAIAEGSPA